MSTRLAPAARCADALSFEAKRPVHSSATSTPSSFHGSCAGSLRAVTFMAPLPTLIVSPLTVTSPGKRPCTVSKRRRCALVSTGPRSLMPTTSMSVRPASTMARRTLRPMRPNPLMATRTDILRSLCARSRPRAAMYIAPRTGADKPRKRRVWSAFLEFGQGHVGDPLGGNAEMLVEVLVGGARPERGHADEQAVAADHGVPALPDSRLDRDV